VTKIEIINKVAEDTGLTKVKAEEAVETIISAVKETLRQGEPVILRRFGSFRVRSKSDRIGRNPKTGEEAPIAARKVVRFKSGKHFREAVNGGVTSSSFEL
jgi:nucleoid DNA-binding protein